MRRNRLSSPIRSILKETSPLAGKIVAGIGAVESSHHEHLDASVRSTFADSLDLDEALREDHPDENRWDYLLGLEETSAVIALEPHSAKEDQVSAVIRKQAAAKQQLARHLRPDRANSGVALGRFREGQLRGHRKDSPPPRPAWHSFR